VTLAPDWESLMIADNFTLHAQARLQQRGIPPLVIELLERFGSCVRSCGADRLIFDKAAITRLRRHLGGDRGLRVIDRWLNVYAVIGDDGRFVTVSHQHRRIWRN
jgi:hypothetical protein